MNFSNLSAGTSRFAHLAGLARSSRRMAEDDEDQDDQKGKRSRRASEDDPDDDGDDDKCKGKRSRRASEDDEDDDEDDSREEMHGRNARASARVREQQRIAAILGHSAAAANLPLAVSLACETRMTRREAIRTLRGQVRQNRSDRDDDDGDHRQNRHARTERMNRNTNLGTDVEITGTKAVDASWGAAFAKAGIKTR